MRQGQPSFPGFGPAMNPQAMHQYRQLFWEFLRQKQMESIQDSALNMLEHRVFANDSKSNASVAGEEEILLNGLLGLQTGNDAQSQNMPGTVPQQILPQPNIPPIVRQNMPGLPRPQIMPGMVQQQPNPRIAAQNILAGVNNPAVHQHIMRQQTPGMLPNTGAQFQSINSNGGLHLNGLSFMGPSINDRPMNTGAQFLTFNQNNQRLRNVATFSNINGSNRSNNNGQQQRQTQESTADSNNGDENVDDSNGSQTQRIRSQRARVAQILRNAASRGRQTALNNRRRNNDGDRLQIPNGPNVLLVGRRGNGDSKFTPAERKYIKGFLSDVLEMARRNGARKYKNNVKPQSTQKTNKVKSTKTLTTPKSRPAPTKTKLRGIERAKRIDATGLDSQILRLIGLELIKFIKDGGSNNEIASILDDVRSLTRKIPRKQGIRNTKVRDFAIQSNGNKKVFINAGPGISITSSTSVSGNRGNFNIKSGSSVIVSGHRRKQSLFRKPSTMRFHLTSND